jgi:hypothetical protein
MNTYVSMYLYVYMYMITAEQQKKVFDEAHKGEIY